MHTKLLNEKLVNEEILQTNLQLKLMEDVQDDAEPEQKNVMKMAFNHVKTPDEVEIIKVVGPKNTVKSKNVVVNLKSGATVNHESSPHQQPQNVNKNLPNYQNQASTAMQANSMENNPAFKSNAAQFVYQVWI